jgi:hypothetical protein
MPIELEATMVHEVPRGSGRTPSDRSVTLSENPTVLDAATDRFIREQMLLPSLGSSREVVEDPTFDQDSSVLPAAVKQILDDPMSLPECSRTIAEHLFQAQSGAASAGIFLASKAKFDGRDVVVLTKAEHQEGVRLRQSGTVDHVAFQVEHITELIVGKNSRVYKIAILWVEGSRLVGRMIDKQNGVAFADYFLGAFLQMTLRHKAELATQGFVNTITKQIESAAWSPEKKTRYVNALVAVLDSPEKTIDPQQFLRTFIDREDRDGLAAALPHGSDVAFRKDTTLVEDKVGGLKMQIADGSVEVRASRHAVDVGIVKVESEHPDGPRVTIIGAPDSIKPARPPR